MAWTAGIRTLPSFRKWLLALAAVVGVVAILGFFALPPILKSVARDRLAGALHRNVAIREIRLNPFTLAVSVRGLEISERNDTAPWISVEEIFANLQLASVYRMGPVLKEIRLTKPHVRIVRRKDGTYNFTDIIEESNKVPTDNAAPLKYSFNNIQVIDGRVDFLDGPKGARHKVEGIQVAIPFISNLNYAVDRYVTPSFAAVVNGDAVFIKGWTKPFKESQETACEINIAEFEIPRYLEYLPFHREYEVPSALLDVKAILRFLKRKDGPPSVSVDGYALLRDVRVTGRDKSPMVYLPSVRAVVLPVDIGAGEYRLASLTVKDPEIDVVIDRNNKLNLLSLMPYKNKGNQPGKEGGKAASGESGDGGKKAGKESVFSIDSVRLTAGKVRFTDASRQDVFKTALKDIRVDVDSFSTGKGRTAAASLALSTEAGESVGLDGSFSLAPAGSEGTLTIGKLALKKYATYYRDQVLFDVMRGALDLRTGYSFAQTPEGNRFRLHGLAASLDGLRLRQRDEKEDFLDIPAFSVKDARIDPGLKEIEVGEIATGKGRIAIRKGADGVMNVSRLVPGGAGPGDSGKAAPVAAERAAEGKPWLVTLKKTSVDRYDVRFKDGGTTPPVELIFDGMRLRAENITTAKNRKGSFSFETSYNRTGKLSLGGSVSVDPPSMAGRLRARDLPIGPLQPYYAENVKILLTGGGISADGLVRVSAPRGGSLQGGYKGEASVKGFSSVDKAQGEDFLKFDTLHFGGIDAGYQPTSVVIREIALSDFYSRIIVNADGTLNVQGIVAKGAGQDNAAAGTAKEDAEAKTAKAEGAAVPVRIDNVTLQGGDVSFSDRHIRPNFSADLSEVGGRVTGLSSTEEIRADVDLRGKLGKTTPLEIKGKINPLAKDLFLDLAAGFKDMDLSQLTPYSGWYAGYEIQKGMLSMDLSYRIERKKLDAEHNVFLDQFTFGNPVESAQATKLPVRLAVSLLKDRKGEIHLDLPVTGQIDDPKFSVWRIVWKIIGNLLVKAATAPFALIGAMFGGGGEELAYIEFDPGMSDIPAAGMGKLQNLGKALFDRPALKLEIEGHADLEKDPEALRQVVFRRKVAAQKVKALARAGQAAPAVDNVRIDPAEYPKYLALAYNEEKFPKPRNVIGMAKDLPVPEMEKLMVTHIRVTDGDLRQLAVDRAARVRDALVADGKVEPGRVFLVEPKSLAPAKKEKLKDSRVDFLIK